MILLADLHLHEYAKFSSISPQYGINTRLLDGLRVLYDASQAALEDDKQVAILGDVHFSRTEITTTAMHATVQIIEQFSKRGVLYSVIPGNHDVAPGQDRQHALHYWKSYAKVYESPTVDQWGIGWIPYTHDHDAFLRACEFVVQQHARVLFVHQGFGSRVFDFEKKNWAFFLDNICSVDELPDRPLFAGHYHRHAMIGDRGMYVGSPLALNWSDDGEQKMFWKFDIETLSFEPVSTSAPRFLTFDVKTLQDVKERAGEMEGHIVRLRIPDDFPYQEAAQWIREHVNVRGLDLPIRLSASRAQEQVGESGSVQTARMSSKKLLSAFLKKIIAQHRLEKEDVAAFVKRALQQIKAGDA